MTLSEFERLARDYGDAAAKCEKWDGALGTNEVEDRCLAALLGAFAALERERDEARAKEKEWERTYLDRISEWAKKARADLDATESRASRLAEALADVVALAERVVKHVPSDAVKAEVFWDGQVNRIGRARALLSDGGAQIPPETYPPGCEPTGDAARTKLYPGEEKLIEEYEKDVREEKK